MHREKWEEEFKKFIDPFNDDDPECYPGVKEVKDFVRQTRKDAVAEAFEATEMVGFVSPRNAEERIANATFELIEHKKQDYLKNMSL